MLRPVSLLRALAAATLGGALLGAPVPATAKPAAPVVGVHTAAAHPTRAARAKADDASPLAVTIDGLTPSALPKSGPITVSGTVTNVDTQTWHSVNLYPFIGPEPKTTAAQLAEAAKTDFGQEVGSRITRPGPYYTIGELAPGQTMSYSFLVPRKRIAAYSAGVKQGLAGAYWFGVHALGESDEGRDLVADGKARTFLPLVPATEQGSVETALVLSVRHAVRHDADGRLSDVAAWTRTLSVDGQLRRLADLGVAAGGRPLTWLVDPAVTDAAVKLGDGNHPRSLDPTVEPGQGDDGSASPSPTESESPTAKPSDSESPAQDEATAAAAAAAKDWLLHLHTALNGAQILSLPYGDLDVAAAASHQPASYDEARARSGDVLAPWGLPTTPAVSAPSGYLPLSALDLVKPPTRVLVSDRMVGAGSSTVVSTDGRDLVVASTGAASGGPGPDDPLAPVAMRQRILSEAAVRLLSPDPQPLVVMLPETWAPSSADGFFSGLDVPWLDLTTVDQVAQHLPSDVPVADLAYPQAQREAELDEADFSAADELSHAGDTLQNLLALNNRIGGDVRDEALANLSYATREQQVRTRLAAHRSRDWINEKLQSVEVEAPSAVILSSGSGPFSATVTNTLDQPVTVRLKANTDPLLKVTVPAGTVDVAANASTTIRLTASSRANGVRNATLLLTDSEGTFIGSSDSLPIRSSRVSNVIWLILGTGVALLFGTIVIRLVRRLRSRSRS